MSSIKAASAVNHSEVIRQTQKWLETVVIGENFCPFAGRALVDKTVAIDVVAESGFEECLKEVNAACERLDDDEAIRTTLLVLPVGFDDFADYLDLLEIAERLLVEQDYEGIYQIASFHPDYCFADSHEDDPANYSNRSPYPILHLLREADVELAIASHPNVEAIPAANIERARQLGLDELDRLLKDCFDD